MQSSFDARYNPGHFAILRSGPGEGNVDPAAALELVAAQVPGVAGSLYFELDAAARIVYAELLGRSAPGQASPVVEAVAPLLAAASVAAVVLALHPIKTCTSSSCFPQRKVKISRSPQNTALQ